MKFSYEKTPKSESENHEADLDRVRQVRENILSDLSSLEREKSVAEIEIINNVNDATTRIMERYAVPAINAEDAIVRIIPENNWPGGGAFSSRKDEVIVVPEQVDLNKLKFILTHEMFHFKGVNWLPTLITEAIVEKLTNEALNIDNSAITGIKVFDGVFTYDEYRKTFDSLIEKIVQHTQGKSDFRHIFSFFARAHLSGDGRQLLFLDEAFGPGTFVKMDELSDNFQEVSRFIESLE